MSLTDNILATDYTQYACNVYLNGAMLPSYYQIISVQIKQGYQYISSAQILIKQDVGFYEPLIPDPLLKAPISGEQIAVKANLNGDEIVLFDGFIVKHNYKTTSQGTRLQLTAKDKIINLAMKTQTEVFAKQSDKEVIDTIVQGSNFSLQTNTNITTQLSTKHTQLVKHEINDWDFINLRAEANSCFVYTEKETIYIDKPTPELDTSKVITGVYGVNIYELQLEQDDRKNQIENELISFDTTSLESVIAEEENMISVASNNIKGKHASINYRTYNNLEASQLVGAINQLKSISTVNGVAHIHANLVIKPGATLVIVGYNSMVDKSYIITSVLHDYSNGGFTTYVQFGLHHESFASKYHLGHKQHKAPLVVSGIVKQLEKDPDNLYRILVNIPSWKNAQESVWARTSTSYAGDQYGMVLMPEIGDEVLVTFIGNDFDAPVVIGSTFNPKTPPHTPYQDDNFEKVFITKKGMKWSWNDDKAIHEISTPAGNKILISEDTKSIIILDQNQNKIEMKDDAISINGNLDINIKAAKDIKMEAVNIEINASGINKIKGGTIQIN